MVSNYYNHYGNKNGFSGKFSPSDKSRYYAEKAKEVNLSKAEDRSKAEWKKKYYELRAQGYSNTEAYSMASRKNDFELNSLSSRPLNQTEQRYEDSKSLYRKKLDEVRQRKPVMDLDDAIALPKNHPERSTNIKQAIAWNHSKDAFLEEYYSNLSQGVDKNIAYIDAQVEVDNNKQFIKLLKSKNII